MQLYFTNNDADSLIFEEELIVNDESIGQAIANKVSYENFYEELKDKFTNLNENLEILVICSYNGIRLA